MKCRLELRSTSERLCMGWRDVEKTQNEEKRDEDVEGIQVETSEKNSVRKSTSEQ